MTVLRRNDNGSPPPSPADASFCAAAWQITANNQSVRPSVKIDCDSDKRARPAGDPSTKNLREARHGAGPSPAKNRAKSDIIGAAAGGQSVRFPRPRGQARPIRQF
jgi:hypothetical protein